MKAIVVMFDSMSRHYLPPYGNNWVQAPNFERLAERSVTFDRCYVGSMPCIPARRELHTGRYNFLHRSWGPLEPFDDSMPEILRKAGIYTHMATDHYHYWQDGGATYHSRFNSFEFARGQEGDQWKGEVEDPVIPRYHGSGSRQDWVNRKYLQNEEDYSQTKMFDHAKAFIDTNAKDDDWYLHVECFDPHPPFMAPQRFRDLYPHDYDGPHFDWPRYGPMTEDDTQELVDHIRKEYAALISMCDYSLGRIMDAMDEHDLWDDTMLIVTTDHGFLLGEHDWWAFVRPPFYDEVSVKPLFIWDPRCSRAGERTDALVQTHDIPATLLEYFDQEIPPDMHGKPLRETVATGEQVRDYALFGVFGGHVNITDGRYVYMRAPAKEANEPLYQYTQMPTHMTKRFSMEEMRTMQLAPPFRFTKGSPVNRIDATAFMADAYAFGTLLYDLAEDPSQQTPITDPELEDALVVEMLKLMDENDAPREQYERLGLPDPTVRDGS